MKRLSTDAYELAAAAGGVDADYVDQRSQCGSIDCESEHRRS